MKNTLTALAFVLSVSVFAQDNWTKTFYSDECGFSESEATSKATKAAQNEANYYESVCKGAQGNYSVKFFNSSCTNEPQTLTCPVTCSVRATADCTF